MPNPTDQCIFRRLLSSAGLIILWLSPHCVAQDDSPKTAAPGAKIDQTIVRFMHTTGATSGTVCVSRGHEVLYARGYGFVDREKKVPTRPNAVMRIASCSKPFTAAVCRKLISQQKLALDTLVFDYLKIWPEQDLVDERIKQITVEHLLMHRAGWDRAETFDPMFEFDRIKDQLGLERDLTKRDIVKFMWSEPLQTDPGSQTHYSNFGYLLLGMVIEKATGHTYLRAVKESLSTDLEDLSISSTLGRARHPREVFYETENNLDLHLRDSSSGLAASAPTLCRFMGNFWLDGFSRGPRIGKYFFQIGTHPFTTTAIIEQRADGLNYAILLNSRRNEGYHEDNLGFRDQFNHVLDSVGGELSTR